MEAPKTTLTRKLKSVDTQFLLSLLPKCGFHQVRTQSLEFDLNLDKEWVFQSIRNRYVSTLCGYSDSEIEDGIKKLAGKWSRQSNILWKIRKDIIVAKKNGNRNKNVDT